MLYFRFSIFCFQKNLVQMKKFKIFVSKNTQIKTRQKEAVIFLVWFPKIKIRQKCHKMRQQWGVFRVHIDMVNIITWATRTRNLEEPKTNVQKTWSKFGTKYFKKSNEFEIRTQWKSHVFCALVVSSMVPSPATYTDRYVKFLCLEKPKYHWVNNGPFLSKFVKFLENKLSKICKILKIKVARRMRIL